MVASQHNAWIHAAATVVVVGVGLVVGLSRSEWSWIVLAIVSVWTAEALNTAFEFPTDVASPNFHPIAEKAKDVAAGAVLLTAVGANPSLEPGRRQATNQSRLTSGSSSQSP